MGLWTGLKIGYKEFNRQFDSASESLGGCFGFLGPWVIMVAICLGIAAIVLRSCDVTSADLFSVSGQADNSTSSRSQPAQEHVALAGEKLYMSMGDLRLMIPAQTLEAVSVYRADTARYFWSDPPSAPLELSANCGPEWITETPTYSHPGSDLLDQICLRNPSDQDVRVILHCSR